ncbi:MAG TPA: hypothetical protein VJM12_18860 [Pyrinomonadaceae bacterium]|nr:hypothetical protein [Pyrinomonadaceae bacterium]
MRTTLTLVLSLIVTFALSTGVARGQETRKEKGGVRVVATHEIAATVAVGNSKERITGRFSFNLVANVEGGRRNEVAVQDFNIVFFGVPQKLIAGGAPVSEPLGVLGFAVVSGKKQSLRYDAQKRQVTGQLQMFADASFLNAFAEPARDARNDLFITPTFPVAATIRVDLDKPLGDPADEPRHLAATLDFQLQARGFRVKEFNLPSFEIRLNELVKFPIELAPILIFEVARKLCIQPVRFVRLDFGGFPPVFPFIQFTGAGLPFGEPGARREWRKADIVFEIRDWKTFFRPEFFVMAASERFAIRELVEDDDCIEVYFPREFSPEDLFGGGVTAGPGTAGANIISSDGNASGGIDLTHLAHELGHVLGLLHPGDTPTATAQPGSTGTLMCPSGFLRDNPARNSQENKDLVSNPLLVFAIKLRSPGPDCLNSADCGRCP